MTYNCASVGDGEWPEWGDAGRRGRREHALADMFFFEFLFLNCTNFNLQTMYMCQ